MYGQSSYHIPTEESKKPLVFRGSRGSVGCEHLPEMAQSQTWFMGYSDNFG